MGFLQAADGLGITWYDVVLHLLAGFGGLVLLLMALRVGLEELGPRVYELRRAWHVFKRHLTAAIQSEQGEQGVLVSEPRAPSDALTSPSPDRKGRFRDSLNQGMRRHYRGCAVSVSFNGRRQASRLGAIHSRIIRTYCSSVSTS